MNCPECGTSVSINNLKCLECGFPLRQKKEIGGPIKNRAITDYIEKNVVHGEMIYATLVGLSGDFLLVTDKKIVIMKKGIATWATGGFGLKAKSYFIDRINSIDIANGLIFCELEIVCGGMTEKKSGGFFESASLENVIQFEKKLYNEVTIMVNDIRQMIDEKRNSAPIAGQPAPTDVTDQIFKLSILKEQGILTEGEFQAKKTELLKRM